MGMSYVAAISCGLVLVTGILAQIGTALNDMENIVWIPGGWSVASAVSFSIAGGFSDIFGRRYVLITGQIVTLIGCVSKILDLLKHVEANSVCLRSLVPPQNPQSSLQPDLPSLVSVQA